MLDTLKNYLPGWAIAVIAAALGCALIGLITWETTGSVTATAIAVLSAILGPGLVGAYGIHSGGPTPPVPPTGASPVTP